MSYPKERQILQINADKQMTLLTLTNYSTLIDAALEANYIEEKDVTLLQEWKKDPENWGK